MSIQSIQLADLRPPAHNPRRVIADDALDELAASIHSDGLLQNLVVAPSRGKTYKVISGERRFRALKLLCERGDIDESFEVPVEIRSKLSKRDKLRIATVENVQRENLAPIDEAEAFAELARSGVFSRRHRGRDRQVSRYRETPPGDRGAVRRGQTCPEREPNFAFLGRDHDAGVA